MIHLNFFHIQICSRFFSCLSGMLVFLLILSACHRTKTEYYPDGKKRMELVYKGKDLDGPAVWYHKNGMKSYEFHYKRGKLEGVSERWWPNGNKQTEEFYNNDLKEGRSRTWNEGGRLILESNYVRDTLHGPYREYFSSGQVMVEGSYRMGKFDGTWKYYQKEGLQVGQGTFSNGTGVQLAWYENGKNMRETHYVDGLKEGKETSWDRTGKVETVVEYQQGIPAAGKVD